MITFHTVCGAARRSHSAKPRLHRMRFILRGPGFFFIPSFNSYCCSIYVILISLIDTHDFNWVDRGADCPGPGEIDLNKRCMLQSIVWSAVRYGMGARLGYK